MPFGLNTILFYHHSARKQERGKANEKYTNEEEDSVCSDVGSKWTEGTSRRTESQTDKKSIQLSVFVKLLNNEGKCTMHHLHHNFYNLV